MQTFFTWIKSIIEFATKFVAYLFTVPGIVLTSVIGIVSYSVQVIQQLSNQSSTLVTAANTFANSYDINTISPYLADSWFSLVAYAGAIDVLLNSVIAIFSFFLFLIILVVFAYFYWLVPLISIIITVRILLALFRRFVPKAWLPDLSVDVPQIPFGGMTVDLDGHPNQLT